MIKVASTSSFTADTVHFVGWRPLASTAPGARVCGCWHAVSPPGWLSGIGLGRIQEYRTLPWRERRNGL